MIVRAKTTVRYKSQTYKKDETLQIEKRDFNPKYFDIIEELVEEEVNKQHLEEKIEEKIKDFNKLTVSELRIIAENLGLTGYSNLKKAKLIELIEGELDEE